MLDRDKQRLQRSFYRSAVADTDIAGIAEGAGVSLPVEYSSAELLPIVYADAHLRDSAIRPCHYR
jgi:hypothetical protein